MRSSSFTRLLLLSCLIIVLVVVAVVAADPHDDHSKRRKAPLYDTASTIDATMMIPELQQDEYEKFKNSSIPTEKKKKNDTAALVGDEEDGNMRVVVENCDSLLIMFYHPWDTIADHVLGMMTDLKKLQHAHTHKTASSTTTTCFYKKRIELNQKKKQQKQGAQKDENASVSSLQWLQRSFNIETSPFVLFVNKRRQFSDYNSFLSTIESNIVSEADYVVEDDDIDANRSAADNSEKDERKEENSNELENDERTEDESTNNREQIEELLRSTISIDVFEYDGMWKTSHLQKFIEQSTMLLSHVLLDPKSGLNDLKQRFSNAWDNCEFWSCLRSQSDMITSDYVHLMHSSRSAIESIWKQVVQIDSTESFFMDASDWQSSHLESLFNDGGKVFDENCKLQLRELVIKKNNDSLVSFGIIFSTSNGKCEVFYDKPNDHVSKSDHEVSNDFYLDWLNKFEPSIVHASSYNFNMQVSSALEQPNMILFLNETLDQELNYMLLQHYRRLGREYNVPLSKEKRINFVYMDGDKYQEFVRRMTLEDWTYGNAVLPQIVVLKANSQERYICKNNQQVCMQNFYNELSSDQRQNMTQVMKQFLEHYLHASSSNPILTINQVTSHRVLKTEEITTLTKSATLNRIHVSNVQFTQLIEDNQIDTSITDVFVYLYAEAGCVLCHKTNNIMNQLIQQTKYLDHLLFMHMNVDKNDIPGLIRDAYNVTSIPAIFKVSRTKKDDRTLTPWAVQDLYTTKNSNDLKHQLLSSIQVSVIMDDRGPIA